MNECPGSENDFIKSDTYAYPASLAQQRLWFLDKFLTRKNIYNVSIPTHWHGSLDINALQLSLNKIVARHEVLRTIFTEQGSEPLQIIIPSGQIELPFTDLSKVSEHLRQEKLQQIQKDQQAKLFNLEKGPLLWFKLVRLTEKDHVLLFVIHHIVFDGWSRNIFFRELKNLYSACIHNETSSLPELPIQYADYSVWHSKQLQSKPQRNQLDYWKTQLADITALALPTDHPRPKQQSYRGKSIFIQLPSALTQNLKAFSQTQRVTLFMTLLASFQVLLHRYCNQDDIVIGCPIAGRNNLEVQNLIGFFANTLVLRSDLSGNPSFVELLQRVRKTCVDAYAHQDTPFEKLVAELQPQRDMSRNPLFQVALVLQPFSSPEIQLPDLTISRVYETTDTAKFDLLLDLQEDKECIKGTIEYSTDLFATETIKRLQENFQTLLAGIVNNPQQDIDKLPLLTVPERQQLLVEWNDTQTDYPTHSGTHQLFEKQVEQTPDNIAVIFEEQRLSYRQLNDKINQLAHYLRELKTHAGDLPLKNNPLIAISVDRSPDMVVGLLAILKCGAAYVPIDPNYPKARIHYMLADCAPVVLLTQSHLLENFPPEAIEHDCVVVCLDKIDSAQISIANPELTAPGMDLAYVIYTSGSTGQPKGVMVEHRNLSNFLQDMQQRVGMTTSNRLLAITSISFDIAALELFLPLISGCTLYIATKSVANDGLALTKLLARHDIDYMQGTPATWELLKQNNWQADKRLNILCGGEALSLKLANYLFDNGKKVWNVYGPTETTIYSSVYPIKNSPSIIPSIGGPIANTRIYILNEQQQLQPANIPGELCIAGTGLARGYLNRPELNAEKFIKVELFGKTERIYKTGDLAKWRPEGSLEFLGRIDAQVKLRGFRIELGEIESALNQHPHVNKVVVILREDQPDDKRLTAYLTHFHDGQVKAIDLRLFLKEKLPDYMIPSTFVLLDKLPLTPNGKIDRNALPAPGKISLETEQSYVAPRSPVEEMLVNIWQDVLNMDRVGINDNFFELGGHSLLAVQLMVRINQRLDIDCPLHLLFEAPIIIEFSVLLQPLLRQDRTDQINAIKAIPRNFN